MHAHQDHSRYPTTVERNPERNAIYHHSERYRHLIHHLLPIRHLGRREEPDLHRDRLADPDSHQLPLHNRQDHRVHPRRAGHLHRPRRRHHRRVELHHRCLLEHRPGRPRPNQNCHLHRLSEPDRHRHQRSLHDYHRRCNHQRLHPRCLRLPSRGCHPCSYPSWLPSWRPSRVRCARGPIQGRPLAIHRRCRQGRCRWLLRWSARSRCLGAVRFPSALVGEGVRLVTWVSIFNA